MDPCQDSKDSSCVECMAFIQSIAENPDPYLASTVFSDKSTCRGLCGDQPCPIRISGDHVYPFCEQHLIENIVTRGHKVVLILGITVSTMYNGTMHGIRDRVVHLPEACDVVICYDIAIEKDDHEVWEGRTLIGLGGSFDRILQKYPYLVRGCDLVFNDYSTAKFFPSDFPAILFKLLRTETGVALLQDITCEPPIVPFRIGDRTEPTHESLPCHYEVRLMDGRTVRVSGISRKQKTFTAAQLLFRVQILSQSVLSRDTRLSYAGTLVGADEDLLGTRSSGSTFHLVTMMGTHFIDPYATYFQIHRQYPYAPYPVSHRVRERATDVWMLQPRTIMELESGVD
jgi:hypothetical protein